MSTKRKYFTLQEKSRYCQFHQRKSKYGNRKIVRHYECGKTNTQSILRHKDEIVSGLEEKANAIIKNGGPAEFTGIKNAIWKWLYITREANVTVKAPMIQEKAR